MFEEEMTLEQVTRFVEEVAGPFDDYERNRFLSVYACEAYDMQTIDELKRLVSEMRDSIEDECHPEFIDENDVLELNF